MMDEVGRCPLSRSSGKRDQSKLLVVVDAACTLVSGRKCAEKEKKKKREISWSPSFFSKEFSG